MIVTGSFNFGNQPAQFASLGDFVWHDQDADGVQDGTEPGIPGVEVRLYKDNAFTGLTTTTNASGLYSFTNLVPGSYSVQFVQPAGFSGISPANVGSDLTDSDGGFSLITAPVTLVAGETNNSLDQGFYKTVRIGNYVWTDVNLDGLQNDGASNGVNGVTVTLFDSAGVQVGFPVVTANDLFGNPGYYLFNNVTPGEYYVTFAPPAGAVFTLPLVGLDTAIDSNVNASGQTGNFTVVSGVDDLTIDAGIKPIDLSLTKSVDDATPALGQNVVFTLTVNNANGFSTATGVTVKDALPTGLSFVSSLASQGSYSDVTNIWSIGTIAPGATVTLTITATVVTGGTKTNYAQVQAADQVDVDSTPGNDSNDEDDDDKVSLTPTAALGDYVWLDSNANGQQDSGEPGLDGVKVELLDSSGTSVLATAFTGDNPNVAGTQTGYYEFIDLAPGSYVVKFYTGAGYDTFTVQDTGSDATDSDADPVSGLTGVYTLVSGEFNSTVDAGLKPIDLSLTKSVDDATPALGQNVVFTLTVNNANGFSTATGVTVKDALPAGLSFVSSLASQGSYSEVTNIWSIGTIAPGATVTLTITATVVTGGTKTNYAQVQAADQVDVDSTPGNDSNDEDDDDKVSLTPTAALGDYVWLDSNANGQQDSGEPGLDGVKVELLDSSGTSVLATAFTGDNPNVAGTQTGYYEFIDLAPGSYVVKFYTGAGYDTFTVQDTGSDATDSDADPVSGLTGVYTLVSGEFNSTVDAGLKPIDLSLTKSVDDATPEVGTTVEFTITVTNANGFSTATGVTVKDVLPVGLTYVSDNAAGAFDSVTGIWSIGTLAPGASVTLKVNALVATGGLKTNLAQVQSADQLDIDSTPGNAPGVHEDDDDEVSLIPPASLGDYVWHDENADGLQADIEPPIANATVRLLQNGIQIATTTTDAVGFYSFTGLAPGDYQVQFDYPAGFTNASPANVGSLDNVDSDGLGVNLITDVITLSSGEYDNTIDQGFYKLVNLGNYVWYDVNNDGIQNEPANLGVNGVTVTLFTGLGVQVGSPTVTGDDGLGNPGYYLFTDLTPGEYYVVFTAPTGQLFTTANAFGSTPANDSDANSLGQTAIIGLLSGQDDLTVDAGLKPIDLSLTKSVDDTTPAIGSDVTYTVTVSNANDFSTATGVTVRDVLPPGLVYVSDNGAGAYNSSTGVWTIGTLLAGQSVSLQVVAKVTTGGPKTNLAQVKTADQPDVDSTPNNAPGSKEDDDDSVTIVPSGSIGNYVWLDLNNNGIQDEASSLGINGVTVTLFTSTGVQVGSPVVTGFDGSGNPGYYLFTDLNPGSYYVVFTAPSGQVFTSPFTGSNVQVDSNADATGKSNTIALASGESNLTIDAGIRPIDLSITKTVSNATPRLLSNVSFTVTVSNASGFSTASGVTVKDVLPAGLTYVSDNSAGAYSNATGIWTIGTLAPGSSATLTITVVVATGGTKVNLAQVQTANEFDIDSTPGNAPDVSEDDDASVSLTPPAGLGNFVWNDINANGIQDPTEPGIPGAVVKLRNSAGTEIATTTTDSFGAYSFIDLAPGTYSVAFNQPIGFTAISPANVGSDESVDSDGVGALLITAPVTLVSGEFNPNLDQGFYTPNVQLVCVDLDLQGNTPLKGTLGNVRSYTTSNGVSVNASAFSRDRATGAWATAYLGAYGGGLGVTDGSEGDGSGDTHTVDNLGGFDNYILFEFSQSVVIDAATLGYVVGDSDLTVWIGTVPNAYGNHQTLSDSLLSSFYTEENLTTLSSARVADINAGGISGNILIIAALASDTSPEDRFKVGSLRVCPVGDTASIGDFVWNDYDLDGLQDANEPGIAGAVVKLKNSSGTDIATTTTNADGLYSFTGLVPGTYSVQFVQPSGFAGVSPANVGSNDSLDSDGVGTSLTTAPITLVAGENNTSIDQGFYKSQVCVAIGLEGNTALDGTDGIVRTFSSGSVSVKASAFSRDRVTSAWSTAYLGSYGGGLGVTDNSEGDGSGNSHTVDNLGGRDNYVLFRFSEAVVLDAAYLGYVVNDSDLTVWIGNVPNAFNTNITLTDALLSGFYVEENLTTLTGARLADLNAAGIAGNVIIIAALVSDTSPEDQFKIGELDVCTPGQILPASLGNFVWHDMNGNGIQESNEPGIGGAVVTLTSGGADGLINGVGDVVTSTTTDSAGAYSFTNLTPGTQYRVGFSTPSGFSSVSPRKAGSNTALDSDGLVSDIVILASGQNNDTIDAGFYKDVRVGNYVWRDLDSDGIQDSTESGIAGVVVTLSGTSGSGDSVTRTTTTASDGTYNFTALPPGTYQVTVAASNFNSGGALEGMTATQSLVGTNRAVDSNTNPSGTSPGTLPSGGVDVTVDFGFNVTTTGVCENMFLEGNTATSGTAGNTITFTSGAISAKASAYSRDSAGAWRTAYLGRYAGGLGVTDGSEGTGSGNSHTVDNIGRNNYILFEFSQLVTVTSAFIGYVSGDSDLRVWVGTVNDPFNLHYDLSDSFLSNLGFTEVSLGGSTTRTANFNAGKVAGNVFVIAANTGESSPNDQFKVAELGICADVPTSSAGTKFYVVDDDVNRTFRYGSIGNYQSQFGVAPTDPRGITSNVAGTNVWIADYNGRIFNYTTAGVHVANWQSNISGLQGVTTNGTHIWTVSETTDRVYYYSNGATTTASRNPTSSFALNSYNTNPTDLTTDGKFIWVVNEGNIAGGVGDMVFKYTVSGTYLGRWQLDAANSRPTGITVDPSGGNKIWIVDNEDDRIYEYSGATGCVSGGLIASASYALNSGNTNPQGIADPPVGAAEIDSSESSLVVNEQYVNPAVNARLNTFNATDVNDDGLTTPLDALLLINRLRTGQSSTSGAWLYEDVSNDGLITPLDALLVINRLRSSYTPTLGVPELPPATLDTGVESEPSLNDSQSAADEVFGLLGEGESGNVESDYSSATVDWAAFGRVSTHGATTQDQAALAIADELVNLRRKVGRSL